ncbi:uncharacterized protein G2W53_010552 [Senna tora]|uniref:Uncharacterized protein n=1 Tax=Senna tora TaxID=362788 RepID=A0A834X183_9FABA|nr:uncharacterized protein G2W53_010552 [Senna tora]
MNYHLLGAQNYDPTVNHVHPPQIYMALTWQGFPGPVLLYCAKLTTEWGWCKD